MVFEEVVLSKRKVISDASPESQLSADPSPRTNPPVSNFTRPTLSPLNLSGNLVFNHRIGDVELTLWADFLRIVLVGCSQYQYCPCQSCSPVVTRYIELRLWLDRCDDVLEDFRTLTDCLCSAILWFMLPRYKDIRSHSID